MNGSEIIDGILEENDTTEEEENESWDNVHSQTWHDSWRNSH